MKAAIQKELPSNGAPHETLLVVDGSVGRNAVEQVAAWRKYVGVTGLAITKLDGTARGGFVVSVVKDQALPVKLIGVGQGVDDLRDFDAVQFVDALLGVDAGRAEYMRSRAGKMMGVSASASDGVARGGSSDSSDALFRLTSSFRGADGGVGAGGRAGAGAGAGDGGGLGTLEPSSGPGGVFSNDGGGVNVWNGKTNVFKKRTKSQQSTQKREKRGG